MIAYLFPGQGSQRVGMGKELFETYKGYVEEADEILGYSIKDLCLADKEKKLGLTQYTQPALYIINALTYLKEQESGVKPDFLAGHSLGEYNALLAGGVFRFADGLKLVMKRGELMGKANGGKMMAIKGFTKDEIAQHLQRSGLNGVDIANLNIPSQTIISGIAEDIEKAQHVFKEAGAHAVLLNVSGAFHSRYMKPAAIEFEEYIKNFTFNEMKIPVVSNYTGRIHNNEEIKDNMVKQIYNSVQWVDSIRYLWGKGVEEFKQVGPGRVAITLATKIMEESTPLVIEDENVLVEKDQNETERKKEIEIEHKLEKDSSYSGKLGNIHFMERYKTKYPYVAGPMHKGISGYDFIKRLADRDIIGFVGTGGLALHEVEALVVQLQKDSIRNYGVSVNFDLADPNYEKELIELLIRENINLLHVSGYFNVTESLVLYKLKGIKKLDNGRIICPNRILLKTSRPEIAQAFMEPASDDMLKKLKEEGKITEEQALLAKKIPVADDVCVMSAAAHKTGMIPLKSLLPQIIHQRNAAYQKYGYEEEIFVGAAGAIGDSASALDAFLLGADFIMTGSINVCTAEAHVSKWVKEKLQKVEIQDTEIIPCSNVYEIGIKMQVLKKGMFFASRALKLYEIYNRITKIEDIESNLLVQIQEKYLGKALEEIYNQMKDNLSSMQRRRAESDSKYKFGLIIQWYYDLSAECAIQCEDGNNMNCMIPLSSAMGRLNEELKNTVREKWEDRHPDELCKMIMSEAEDRLLELIQLYKDESSI